MASILDAAAAYCKVSRQCFGLSAGGVEGVTPLGTASGEVTLIPGCSLKVPRPRVQVVYTPTSRVVSTPASHQGVSLFLCDELTLPHTGMDSVNTAMPDAYAVDCANLFPPSLFSQRSCCFPTARFSPTYGWEWCILLFYYYSTKGSGVIGGVSGRSPIRLDYCPSAVITAGVGCYSIRQPYFSPGIALTGSG